MDLVESLQCTPCRRSLKFVAGAYARHFLIFDSAVSKEDRMTLFLQVFAFQEELVDTRVLTNYKVTPYLPEKFVEVRTITDPRHPAYGQAGLFAKCTIPGNTIVTPYAGFIEIFGTSCNSRTYTMGFGHINDDYALDAEFAGNYGRFANDPRGVDGLSANLSAESRLNSRGESFTALVARRQIAEGEEILMAYGKTHSLGASAWTDVQGRPLLRLRCGGVLPFPLVSVNSDSVTRTSPLHVCSAADGAEKGVCQGAGQVSRLGFSPTHALFWECPQCGMWSHCRPTLVDIEHCYYCHTPKLSGARLVSVVSDHSELRTELVRECTTDFTTDATTPDEEHCTLWSLFDDNPAASNVTVDDDKGAVANRRAACPASPITCTTGGSAHEDGVTRVSRLASAATATPPPLRRRRNWESDLQLAPSSSSTVGCVSGYKVDHSRVTSSPTATAAVPLGASPVTLCYTSEHVDWPLNVPFLPWQIWDPTVPFSAVAKHSKFETHEHIFLYNVLHHHHNPSYDATDTSRGKADVSGDGAASDTVEQSDDSHSDKEVAEECKSSSEPAHRFAAASYCPPPPTEPARAVTECGSADEPMSSPSPQCRVGERKRGRPPLRSRARRAGLWEKQGSREELLAIDMAPSRMQGRPCNVVARGPPCHPAAASQVGDRAEGTLGVPLAQCLLFAHEVERFIVMPGGYPVDRVWASPAALVHHTLSRMTRRIFAGKSFQAGEAVAYVGGVVRLIQDTRCRPDGSPLVVPMRFFLPRALRTKVAFAERTAASRQTAPMLYENTADFLAHLSRLALVVTNEMMYCPCLAVEATDGTSVALPDVRYEEECEALLNACNVALVLTLDALGSPHVVAVATRPIAAFDALLARMQ